MWGEHTKSIGQVVNLIKHIPLEGAFGKRIGALEAQNWQQTEELLAVIAELIDCNTRVFVQSKSKKGAQQPKPLKIPRPWDKPKERRNATSDDLKAIFGGNAEFVPAESS